MPRVDSTGSTRLLRGRRKVAYRVAFSASSSLSRTDLQGAKMPASPEIREAIRQGSWIRKMFEDGAVLKAERGEENVFDFTLGNPYGEPPAALAAELSRLCSDPPPGLHRYMPNAGLPESRRAAARSLSRATGLPFTEDLLVMTVGAAGALNVALRAILSPGDEVAILR